VQLSRAAQDSSEATDGDDSTHPAIPHAASDRSVDRGSLPYGVALFQPSDYQGDYKTFTPAGDGNITELSREPLDGGTSAKDAVSSVVVKGDFQLTLYDEPHFRGEKLVLVADGAYLPDRGFNDRASSLKVRLPAEPAE
jgi:hypothetical protein